MTLLRERVIAVPDSSDSDREHFVVAYGGLLATSLALDYSVYVGGLTHLYVHDLATLSVLVGGLVLARRRGSIRPASPGIWILLGLLAFLALNTILVGAYEYQYVPAAMHKLYWFEHGDAIRVLGGIAVWVWAFGQLDPTSQERDLIFEFVLWGAAATIVVSAAYWLGHQVLHPETTPFDLTVMVSLPIALAYAIRRRTRSDLIRLAIFGGGCLFLYSRSAIVIVIISTLAVLVSARNLRAVAISLGPMAAGALLVVGLTLVIPLLPGRYAPRPTVANTPPAAGTGAPVGPSASPAASSAPTPAVAAAPPAAAGPVAPGSSTNQTVKRAQQLNTATLSDRFAIWRDAIRIFKRSPIIGVGYHDYFLYSSITQIKDVSYLDPLDLFSSRIKQAHNDYLSWLSEAGVIGLALYLAFWALLLTGGTMLWHREPEKRDWHAATLGFLVGLAVVSLFGELLIPRLPVWIAPTIIWWVLIAILLTDLERRHHWPRLRLR